MRLRGLFTAAGLCAIAALTWGSAGGSELVGPPGVGPVTPPVPVKAAKVVKPVKPAATEDGATCGNHGTTIQFIESPKEAAKQAEKEQKLVFVLHVSGEFEDPGLTWNNAEALRVNALANPEVGKFINEHCIASFQKVGTFRIVNGQKQGGNVAAYFCAPDGRVLHCVAGPVDAATMLREAKWVVNAAEKAIAENKKTGKQFKVLMREYHAERLRTEHGLVVEPVTFDLVEGGGALSYRDPSGQPLAPILAPAPIQGPDVNLRELQAQNADAAKSAAPGTAATNLVVDRRGGKWALGNQGRVHHIMAAHSMVTIDKVYGSVFEGILGETISTKPVEVATPFPWHERNTRLKRLGG